MKYIPADKLIAQIKELRSESCISEADDYYEYAKSEILDLITSLQQEQPEVDLEKEIIEAEKKYGDINEMGGYQILLFDDEFRDILRHFYELGLNARKEE